MTCNLVCWRECTKATISDLRFRAHQASTYRLGQAAPITEALSTSRPLWWSS